MHRRPTPPFPASGHKQQPAPDTDTFHSPHTMTTPTNRPAYRIARINADDYPALVRIWEASVRATHTFLAEEELLRIRSRLAAEYFPAVELYAAFADGQPVGFAGTAGEHLEMLFVHPDFFGCGCGKRLLLFALREKGVTRVDVNEQNPHAEGFYRAHSFQVASRDETDAAGRPYPILHMVLRQ